MNTIIYNKYNRKDKIKQSLEKKKQTVKYFKLHLIQQ